jgi:O-antigen ligase
LLVMGCALYIELKFNYPLYRWVRNIPLDTFISQADVNKHVAALMLLAPFGMIFAMRARFMTLAGLLFILCALVLTVTESQSAQLSFVVMILAPFFLLLMPKATPFLTFFGLGFLLVFLPWISPVLFDACADLFADKATLMGQANMSMRLENWDFLSRRIMENPWTGFGIDSTRYMTFDTEQKYFHGNTIIHPHNIALQIWMEFGLIGITLAGGLLTFLYRRLTALTLPQQIMPYTSFCAIMVFLLVSWSVWSSWLDGLILWVAALLILVIRPKEFHATA